MTPAKSSGTRAQIMSKAKAVEGLTETTVEVNTAQRRLDDLRQEVLEAENRLKAAQEKRASYQSHLDQAIQREVG